MKAAFAKTFGDVVIITAHVAKDVDVVVLRSDGREIPEALGAWVARVLSTESRGVFGWPVWDFPKKRLTISATKAFCR